jgi:aldehyde:ferredoxin oxidoreductase
MCEKLLFRSFKGSEIGMRIDRISGGLAGKILRVDLSSKQISTEDTEKYARRFIGGRTINNFILLNETAPGTKWSDPENLLIFGIGCLVGTLAPGACRVSIDTINAFSNGKGSANCGGHFGPELKYAGFDHVVITGKSATPVYLWIHDGEAELRDAGFIWGKKNDETEEILHQELGDSRVEIASIGPAGENLVRGSAVMVDCGQAAGGSGVGCVMGDKKLKAIAVRGHGSIKVAQPEKFLKAVNAAMQKIESSHITRGEKGFAPFRQGLIISYPKEDREEVRKLTDKDGGVPNYFSKMWSCFDCPLGCQPFLKISEGKYKGDKGFTYFLNSIGYSMRVGSDNPAASAKFMLLINQLGLDGDTTAVVTAWAFECYEKGLLTKEATDGLELKWGNDDAWLKLVEKIAYREGFGNLLAGGVVEASRKLGKGSEKLATHCKGQDSVEDLRVRKGTALGVATSPIAGHHLRGTVAEPERSGPKYEDIPWEGTKAKNMPEAVFWTVKAQEIENMTGTCTMMGTFSGVHALEPSDYTALDDTALGIDLTEEELMHLGRSSYNLEKAFNTLQTGFTREDDYPCERYMEEPMEDGPYKGWKCEKDEYDGMLDRFYELHDWDKKTSWQTRRCMAELGLDDIAQKLEEAGKLID